VAKTRDNQREPVYYICVYVHQKRVDDDDDDVVVDRRRRRLPLWDEEKGIRPLRCVFGGFSPPEGIGSRSPTVGIGGRNGATSSIIHTTDPGPPSSLDLSATPANTAFDKQHTRSYARKRYDMTHSITYTEQQQRATRTSVIERDTVHSRRRRRQRYGNLSENWTSNWPPGAPSHVHDRSTSPEIIIMHSRGH
jgi:hypothetical protein